MYFSGLYSNDFLTLLLILHLRFILYNPLFKNGSIFLNEQCKNVMQPRLIKGHPEGCNFIHVSCGKYHIVAISKAVDGSTSVWAIGNNDCGQLGLGNTAPHNRLTRLVDLNEKKIVSASCGLFHTVCVSEDGLMWVFGAARNGQLGTMPKERCNAIQDYKECYPRLTNIPNERVIEVACGDQHTLCRTLSGKVFSMGSGDFGRLGHGDEEDCFMPREIDFKRSGFSGIIVHSIHAGSAYSAIICSVGSLREVAYPGSKYSDDYSEDEDVTTNITMDGILLNR